MTKPHPRSPVAFALATLTFLPVWSACGTSPNSNDGESGQTISAPTITSGAQGLLFTGVPRDPYNRLTSIYFYDFNAGKVHLLSQAEGGNPIVFWDGSKAWHFSRKSEESASVLRFDPLAFSKGQPVDLSERWTINWPAAGDPVSLAAGMKDQVILGAPFSGGLYGLSPRSKVQLVTNSDQEFQVPDANLHPTAIARTTFQMASQFLVAHSSLSQSEQEGGLAVNGESQLFHFTKADKNSEVTSMVGKAIDTNPQTSAIDGVTLSASYPTLLTPLDTGSWSVAGLCPLVSQPCQNGLDIIDLETHKRSESYTLSQDFPYTLQHNLVSGLEPTTVFAQVIAKADQQQQIGLLDYRSGEFEVWHTFAEDRLFGSAFDSESATLIVGEQDSLHGQILLFRDALKVGEVVLDDVFYSGVIIGNGL